MRTSVDSIEGIYRSKFKRYEKDDISKAGVLLLSTRTALKTDQMVKEPLKEKSSTRPEKRKREEALGVEEGVIISNKYQTDREKQI